MSLFAILAALFIFCLYFRWIIIGIVTLFAAASGGVLAGLGAGLLIYLLFKLCTVIFLGGVVAAADRHQNQQHRK